MAREIASGRPRREVRHVYVSLPASLEQRKAEQTGAAWGRRIGGLWSRGRLLSKLHPN